MYDLAVVGAGPAGSTAARYAARRGLKVLLMEKRDVIGTPIQCGEYVASDEEVVSLFPSVTDLDDLMEVPHRTRQIDTPIIRIWTPGGRHYDIPFRGYTVQRDRMDQGLADQAAREGAEVVTKMTCLRVRGDEITTTKGSVRAKVIVAADGPRSRVAREIGLPWPESAPAMSATIDGDFTNVTDLYFGNLAPGGYAWIIPKGSCANVGLGTWQRFNGKLNALFDAFLERRGFPSARGTGGYVPVLGPIPETVRGNVMVVGDAAGHVMATNGGGINVAMICGRIAGHAAADHVQRGMPLSAYEQAWRGTVGARLQTGVRIKRLADRFFASDRALELAMILLGRKRMERAIRCRPLFFGS